MGSTVSRDRVGHRAFKSVNEFKNHDKLRVEGFRYEQDFGITNEDKMPIWIDDLLCNGDERHIKDCPQGVPIGGRGMNCAHKEDLILECSDRINSGGHYDRNGNRNPNIARNGRQILSTSSSTKSEYFSQPNDGQIGNTTKSFEVKAGTGNDNVQTQPFYAIDFNATYTLDTVKVRDLLTDLHGHVAG